ncbi:MAG TPA: DUF3618 domain-containing protein [Gaiellaceae bacterium]|nr:DUF3618 domain-containing protein [Gaiellaceae bacterium]
MTQQGPGDEDPRETRREASAEDRSSEGSPPTDSEHLRQEIRETREQLGETIEAVAEKADVKARAAQEVDERKQQLRQKQDEAKARAAELGRKAKGNPRPTVAVAAFGAALVAGWLVRRR